MHHEFWFRGLIQDLIGGLVWRRFTTQLRNVKKISLSMGEMIFAHEIRRGGDYVCCP